MSIRKVQNLLIDKQMPFHNIAILARSGGDGKIGMVPRTELQFGAKIVRVRIKLRVGFSKIGHEGTR